ncbi:taste receptor type 1 member 3 [Alosa sapidissima]|uniref:taste receptor type 1 member 3 n=1 Tax=Alosa sapidissima TaxID=34773 RepID=UPI001C0889F9|nr:taste receptor type 1 member 3 [Alosa sapidissima]XP_041945160.1 taste receptor type 1 member 3 [Alosa sapidissima]
MPEQNQVLLLCCLCSLGSANWLQNIGTNLFRSRGDIMLGGLFPINELTSNLSQREEPSDIQCNRINSLGLALSLVMKFSVDNINADPNVLPGVRLGFETYDTCQQPAVIMKPTLLFLSNGTTEEVAVKCNYTDYATRAVAVIGPLTSEMSSVVGKLLGFFLMPQISYGSTSDKFSDKQLYPSFMRTVPTDKWQVVAMVELLKVFGWNWVAVVASEDEYGRQGQRQFSALASKENICVAYEGLIPIYSDPVPTIKDILESVNETKVGVVVLFSLAQPAAKFFKEVILRNMTSVWVGSTAWALHNDISTLPDIDKVGTILAFADMSPPLALLDPYFQALFSQIQQQRLNQSSHDPTLDIPSMDNPCPACWYLSPDNMSLVKDTLLQRNAFSVYAAVYSVAQALHSLLGCNATICQQSSYKIYPWQLLEELKNVSLDINGTHFEFDDEGNPSMGYDLLVWTWKKSQVKFREIGNFYLNLSINSTLIEWHTVSNRVPQSTCSADCGKGEVRRVKGFHSCCFDCIPCEEGTFQNHTDDIQCTLCPSGKWSTPSSQSCVYPTYTYLTWNCYESLGLVLAGVVVLVCEVAVGVLFLRHRGTPMVDAAGGALCGLSLLCLIGCSASLVLFLGTPGDLVCRLQLPLNAIFPTVTLSTILATSLQILYVTEFPEKISAHLHTFRGPGSWLVVLACSGVQAGLCGWFVQEAPTLTHFRTNLEVNFVTRFLSCPVTPLLNFGISLGFPGVLALVSFMCTFMALKPAGQYNMARDITISTLAYCVVWVIFVPIYTGLDDKNKSIAHVSVTLISHMGLVAAYFFPKCHLLLKRPELNTADHFRAILEGTITPAQEQPAQ